MSGADTADVSSIAGGIPPCRRVRSARRSRQRRAGLRGQAGRGRRVCGNPGHVRDRRDGRARPAPEPRPRPLHLRLQAGAGRRLGHQPDLEPSRARPAPRAAARLPAGRRRAPDADEPRVRRAPRPRDGHTMHWHGFRTPSALYDGVPEVSIAVPIAAAVHLLLPPARPWHVHVPLPLRGRRARADGHDRHRLRAPGAGRQHGAVPSRKYAYNDGDGSTGYDRHFALLLNELWQLPHDDEREDPGDDLHRLRPELLDDQRPLLPADTVEPRTTDPRSSPTPAAVVARPVQPRRARAAAAREPRLPAARDAAPRNPHEGGRARTRCSAAARPASTPPTGRTPSISARARRAT